MLITYSTNITVTSGANIPFNTNYINTNNNITHTNGDTNITINKCGYYNIKFYSSASTDAAAGNIVPTLVINGVPSTFAYASTYSAAAINEISNSFETIIRVLPTTNNVNVTISVLNNGVNADYDNAVLIIEKVS